jgi:hypothetical protein
MKQLEENLVQLLPLGSFVSILTIGTLLGAAFHKVKS